MEEIYDLTYTRFPSYTFNTLCKGSSTKEGLSPKAIAKRRKKNKNKKTHRKK